MQTSVRNTSFAGPRLPVRARLSQRVQQRMVVQALTKGKFDAMLDLEAYSYCFGRRVATPRKCPSWAPSPRFLRLFAVTIHRVLLFVLFLDPRMRLPVIAQRVCEEKQLQELCRSGIFSSPWLGGQLLQLID